MNNKNMVIVNGDAFEALSEESQAAVLAAAAKAEARGWITSNALQAGLTANLAANGMTVAAPAVARSGWWNVTSGGCRDP